MGKKTLKFYILFSPSVGIFQLYVIHKLSISLMSLLVFWMAYCTDSYVSLPRWSCTTPSQGGRLNVSCFRLLYVAFVPWRLQHHFRGWKKKNQNGSTLMISSPRVEWLWLSLFSVLSAKSSQALLCVPKSVTPMVHIRTNPSGGVVSHHTLKLSELLLWKWLPDCLYTHTTPLGGRSMVSQWLCSFLGPCLECRCQICSQFRVYDNTYLRGNSGAY